MDQRALARKHLERRLAPLRDMGLVTPSRGWLRPIRDSLGMTARQFARRLGVVPSRVTAIEKAEAQGAITLKTLREAAEAIDCTLVYAIVPKRPLDDIVRARAVLRAKEEMARIEHTMELENQALSPVDISAARSRKIDEILEGSPRRLWDEQ